ncbi:hypothetical protein V2J09_024145 [Rumex salicifolius]
MAVIEVEDDKLVQVRFVTKLDDPFKIPPTSIAVGSDFNRLALSSLVNDLLKAGDDEWKVELFDFLIDGELLRLPLKDFLKAKGISMEKTLEIEYIKAAIPKKQHEPCPHDDWVSSVDGSNSSFILTGCYDSRARIWMGAGVCTHVLEGHSGAVTSVSLINRGGLESNDKISVATASDDHTLRLWKLDASERQDHPSRVSAFQILRGHGAAVTSVNSQPRGDMVCSGSWDWSIKLWKINDSKDSVVSLKKRRKDGAETESQTESEAITTLTGHKEAVSSVLWHQNEQIYSASWDHSIRIWDAETGKESWNMSCGHVLHCLDVGGEGSSLVAAGASDNILRVWDPRRPGTLAPVYKFPFHTKWVKSCKWHPKSWVHLLSASYDGKVKLWDLRTQLSLAAINSHDGKVFCADWWKDDSVVSGGEDSKLRIFSGISI